MSLPRPRTLDGKLKTLVVLTTVTALLLSLVSIVIYQRFAAKERLVRELETLADVLGANGATALTSKSPEIGERILSSIDAESHIIGGYFLTTGGQMFATYEKVTLPDLPEIDSEHVFVAGVLALCKDIAQDGEVVGKVKLVSNLDPLARQLRRSATAAVAIFLGCALLALTIGYHWFHHIWQPVNALVQTAAQISKSHDYSLRATRYEDDELGRLTDGFNRMLEQIETSDRELHHANEELARSNAELERFAYVASHDLQEPLRVVTSFSELLEETLGNDLEEEPKKFLDYVVSASRRMRAQIDALLDYSRAGSRSRALEPVDCNLALDGALANLQIAIEECAAEIVRGELPTVLGDLQQLTRVFQNLIGNALKFRREDVVPWVRVASLARVDAWELSVKDNGIGIQPQANERIFEVFQRLHHRSEYPGTGIGLAICRRIIRRHGGQIRVESIPGEGSRFCFTLPNVREVTEA